ncbi:MAG TPA: hypothetical protein VMV22_06320 [Acidimicrobiales bacterium]|nr:hypothetical protein [Acidimicrobiales bacterium]
MSSVVVVGSEWPFATVPAVPTGALYSILLVLHVLCAVVGFGTLVATGVQAARARRGPGAGGAEGVRRYFRPGVNWAGRALYGVPVFGVALLGASAGAFEAGDGFVVVGMALWLLAAVMAEAVVWPDERRVQAALPGLWARHPGADGAGADGAGAFDRTCRRLALSAVVLAFVFVAAVVVMVGKP